MAKKELKQFTNKKNENAKAKVKSFKKSTFNKNKNSEKTVSGKQLFNFAYDN